MAKQGICELVDMIAAQNAGVADGALCSRVAFWSFADEYRKITGDKRDQGLYNYTPLTENYEQVKQAAREGGAKVHLASGAIGGFDVLQTVSLMAQAQHLPETAGIETHTGARGFRNTPVWADHLLTDTEKTTVFTGNAKEAIATFPRRVNVAVATSLATTGPEITDVTMHSVPNWVGDDHRITAEIDGVKAVVDIYSSTSAIAGWSVVALLRNLASPVVFY